MFAHLPCCAVQAKVSKSKYPMQGGDGRFERTHSDLDDETSILDILSEHLTDEGMNVPGQSRPTTRWKPSRGEDSQSS